MQFGRDTMITHIKLGASWLVYGVNAVSVTFLSRLINR